VEFPIDNAPDFWREVAKPAAQSFQRENANLPLALAAIIFLYHLHEKHYDRKFDLRAPDIGTRMNSTTAEMFSLARNLANSGKHRKITIQTRRQSGFSNDFNDDFARPLNVVNEQGEVISLDTIISAMYKHWEDLLIQ
jgi:hypothetical protein